MQGGRNLFLASCLLASAFIRDVPARDVPPRHSRGGGWFPGGVRQAPRWSAGARRRQAAGGRAAREAAPYSRECPSADCLVRGGEFPRTRPQIPRKETG